MGSSLFHMTSRLDSDIIYQVDGIVLRKENTVQYIEGNTKISICLKFRAIGFRGPPLILGHFYWARRPFCMY
jgi:hypothetical protein